jgi:hypothetical protein
MDYEYQYIDEPWNRQTVRIIRISNGKAPLDGGFFGENGNDAESSNSITTHDQFYLKKLQEENEASKRLAYFDIDPGYIENSPGLEDFHAHYKDYEYDGREWQTAIVKL